MAAVLVPRVKSELRVPIAVYAGTIAAMVVAALTMESRTVITRAMLFTASDVIFSVEKFLVKPGRGIRGG